MEYNELVETAYNILKSYNKNQKVFTHNDIQKMAEDICSLPLFSNYKKFIINTIVDRYEENINTKAYMPEILFANKDDDWFYQKKNVISTPFFDRYKEYLEKQDFSEDTIDKIQQSTEEILSMCANPEDITGKNSKRKGLVVGDVQSGKTANYLALINMACDYGYKLIIVLAGLTDTLRIQTQKRVDSGFVGAQSNTMGKGNCEFVGVGEEQERYYAIPLTNTIYDFNKMVKESNNAQPQDYNKPVVLVVKKNSKVLEHVLEALNAKEEKLDKDMVLIIDDEADNASVNTKNPEDTPSAINNGIRKIFNNFNIATYIGYTATPFANIFIDPQFNNDNKFMDLFPSDFIVQLKSPDDYYGGEDLFGNDSSIRILSESEVNFLPTKHKRDYFYPALSESLIEAINCFIINNVLRTYDGAGKKHRSMLINISVYNDVQQQIYYKVDKYIEYIKNVFEQDNYKTTDELIKNEAAKKIYDLYTNDSFYNNENCRNKYTFDDIRKGILSELNKIEIIVFNKTTAKKFNYDDREDGARVIAIGGYVLSRGLTLEGLLVSYYNRGSKAYDTLLQMCRWFGYRPKYKHLCRVYMTEDNKNNFEAVLDAVEDLRNQFTQMKIRGGTPKDFGLLVQESPDSLEVSLLVTSRNKMRNTVQIEKKLNYSGVACDTSKLYSDLDSNKYNEKVIRKFFEDLSNKNKKLQEIDNRLIIKDISNNDVANFISKIKIPIYNIKFNQDALSKYIFNNNEMPNWDVVLVSGGRAGQFEVYGKSYTAQLRSFLINDDASIIRIGGTNNRMINPGIFDAGLSHDEKEIAKNIAKKAYESKNRTTAIPTARDYLSIMGRNPVLVISPMIIKASEENNIKAVEIEKNFDDVLVYGFALGFPGVEYKNKLLYRINKEVLIKLTSEIEEDDLGDDYED